MSRIVEEQRKRREFLYHIYHLSQYYNSGKGGNFPLNYAPNMPGLVGMERNWGQMTNADIAPLLVYHLSEGNISLTTQDAQPPDNGLREAIEIAERSPMAVYAEGYFITTKGIKAVESDFELLECLIWDGAAIDWNKADNTIVEESPPNYLEESDMETTILNQIVVAYLPGLIGNIPDFVAWIGDETRKGSHHFPYKNGLYVFVGNLPVPWPIDEDYPFLQLPCNLITSVGEVLDMGRSVNIRFWVKRAGTGVFDVEAECRLLAVQPYFDDLISRIKRSWPSTDKIYLYNKIISSPDMTELPSSILSTDVAPLFKKIYEWLKQAFNEDDLRELCLELNVDYDHLPGNGLLQKKWELAHYCERHGCLQELEAEIKKQRPHLVS